MFQLSAYLMFVTFAGNDLQPAKPPNIVVILADDMGWGDISINGNTNVRTPHIDSIANDGLRSFGFFVQPVCSPTRAEFLTGRWHPRGGVRNVSTGGERLDLDERTIADAFRASGYATACFGKWHNGTQYPYHPNGRGFEEYFGFTSGHWGEYFSPPLDHNGSDIRGNGYLPDDLTTRAIEFIDKASKADRPFFCYLAYNTPHSPMQVPDLYWNRFKDISLGDFATRRENSMHTKAALAMCENLDDNVGRVLKALSEGKLDHKTIVVFFSDNGPNGPRWNGNLKSHKGSTDEGGVRSPLHIRWPEKIAKGTILKPIGGAIDLYPTLAELGGVKVANDKEHPLDGISLAPWILRKKSELPERILFQHWAGRISARSQQFRLDHQGKLFDMEADPGQQRNVAYQHPEMAAKLKNEVATWRSEVWKEIEPRDNRPFSVGYSEFPRTVLPARDGVPKGGIKRSAPAPNCSYFTNWTSQEDRMVWHVQIHIPGEYEAIVLYTCEPDAVGSEIELRMASTKWTGKISEAHNPPLRGKEHDRVSRGPESFVKDFRKHSLGTTRLETGDFDLVLCAPKVVGKQVADVRAVELLLKK